MPWRGSTLQKMHWSPKSKLLQFYVLQFFFLTHYTGNVAPPLHAWEKCTQVSQKSAREKCLYIMFDNMLFKFWNLCFYCRYPNPSEFTYERRMFRPFEYALQPPLCNEKGSITVNKNGVPPRVSELQQGKKNKKKYRKQSMPYNGPRCFVIPGNHGWS